MLYLCKEKSINFTHNLHNMKNILFFILVLFSTNIFAQRAIYTDNDGDGILEYTLQNTNGKVIETGYYYNGKMHGTWTSFYPSGKKQAVVKFKNGMKHGKWFFYDQQGRTITTVTYENDKKIMASQSQYSSN
jgi:antitoxin component YwqK of YwqJK toxin-antitoxin module